MTDTFNTRVANSIKGIFHNKHCSLVLAYISVLATLLIADNLMI